MKRFLPFLIILAVALAGAFGGVTVYKTKKAEIAAAEAPKLLAGSGGEPGAKPPHMLGREEGAEVVIEEFGDFQCPPCGGLARFLDTVHHEYAGKLLLVFRQFPLANHQHAVRAAAASEAAAAQGRFWQMHKLLYQNQATWSASSDPTQMFESYAQEIGLNMDRYRADIDTSATRGRMLADQARGKSLGVTGTPTLFINDERVPAAALNEPGIRKALDEAIKGKKPIFDSANETKATPTPSQ